MYNFRRAAQPATGQPPSAPLQENDAWPAVHDAGEAADGAPPMLDASQEHSAGVARPQDAPVDVRECPGPNASEESVLRYYRDLVQSHPIAPPRGWRQIRFDLPASVAELRLYPPTPERVQYDEPVQPSPCLVLQLEGCVPAEMSTKKYCTEMVQYLFDLLKYQSASTAMTTLRFVKKGAELSQLVVTFANDVRLATRILVQLQESGISAGYGQPITEFPPNATFQVVDYHMSMHGGAGIQAADLHTFLEPFKRHGPDDMNVIEGYEPGVFYVAVKRPETVYAFLWNPFCSYVLQSALFERYGVLLTMALCPHEFLAKNIPYHIQREQKALAQTRALRAAQGEVDIAADPYRDDDDDDASDEDDDDVEKLDELSSDDAGAAREPAWAHAAQDEIDIFALPTPDRLLEKYDDVVDDTAATPPPAPPDYFAVADAPALPYPDPSHYPALVDDQDDERGAVRPTASGDTAAKPHVRSAAPAPRHKTAPHRTRPAAALSWNMMESHAEPSQGEAHVVVPPPAVPALGSILGESAVGYVEGAREKMSILPTPTVAVGTSIFPGLPAPVLATAILPPPPRPHVQLSIFSPDVTQVAARVEELTRAVFGSVFDDHVAHFDADAALNPSTSVLQYVPVTAHVPPPSAALAELLELLAREHTAVLGLLRNSDDALTETRRRVARALLVAPVQPGAEDWREDAEGRLPALLPYLLASHEGRTLVASLVEEGDFAAAALRRLCRYVAPFLLDADVVQAVCVVALRSATGASNALVGCLLRHWVTLARWGREFVAAAAQRECARDGGAGADVVTRRMVSQMGNAMDSLLAGLTGSQRRACARFASMTQSVQGFADLVRTATPVEGAAAGRLGALWDVDGGALWRTLLRLYVAADIVGGAKLGRVLFAPDESVTREHLYFVAATTTPCAVSRRLGVEAATLCGCFLRRMEMQAAEHTAPESTTSPDVTTGLDEDAAVGLLSSALRVCPAYAAREALWRAYAAPPAPRQRFRRVAARLQVDPVPPTAVVKDEGKTCAEWGTVMAHYPAVGVPFAPLPPGWTSALSRSYGHYYFRPPPTGDVAARPTYRHPTQSREFMATPQAFLRDAETTSSGSVAAVLALARRRAAGQTPVAASITDAEVQAWEQDQRIRHPFLDAAVLELLAIRYRVGGRAHEKKQSPNHDESHKHSHDASRKRSHDTSRKRSHDASRKRSHEVSRKRSRSRSHDESRKRSHDESRKRSHDVSRKRSRSRSHDERLWQQLERRTVDYPAKGVPFPALSTGWRATVELSTGYYMFLSTSSAQRDASDGSRRHPQTRRCYVVTPQNLAERQGISTRVLTEAARVEVAEVERWRGDQRRRQRELDDAVRRLAGLHYKFRRDADEDKGDVATTASAAAQASSRVQRGERNKRVRKAGRTRIKVRDNVK